MTATAREILDTAIGEAGPCPCGCGQIAPVGQKYHDYDRCRGRAYRARRARELEAAGLPTRLSLKVARAAQTPQLRITHAQGTVRTREKALCRDGVQVYFRDVAQADEIRRLLAELGEQREDEAIAKAAVLFQRGIELRERRLQERTRRASAPARVSADDDVALPRELVASGAPRPCPGCGGSGVCPTCHGDGRVYGDENGGGSE